MIYRRIWEGKVFPEPELSNAIKQIEQLKAKNIQLLNILQKNNLITAQEREKIESEEVIKGQKKEYYQYERVDNIDEW